MATSAEEAALLCSLRDGQQSSNNTSPGSEDDTIIVDSTIVNSVIDNNNRTALSSSSLDDDRLLQTSSTPALPPLEAESSSVGGASIDTKSAPPKKARYQMKPKDPRRDTSVPFDEMKRLMRVYGSLKCLRNRTPKDPDKTAKDESVKRKFYRWFPDLDDRFERTEEGWYKPKAGHEEEMAYREMMRKSDQEKLVKKRVTKRASKKLANLPVV